MNDERIESEQKVRRTDIRLYTGGYFELTDPDASQFYILDIAHALSLLCRYTGHCEVFYSVAQHSVLVSQIVPAEHAFEALLHDATEAFIGDVSRPLKMLLPDYRTIEHRIDAAIRRAYDLPEVETACVKHADTVLLRTEQRDLMGANRDTWAPTIGIDPLPEHIVPVMPDEAETMFLARFQRLMPSDLIGG